MSPSPTAPSRPLSFNRARGLWAAVLLAVGCSRGASGRERATTSTSPGADPTAPTIAATTTLPSEPPDARFVAEIKQAFTDYKAWGRVDDRARWAPFDCRAPPPPMPHTSTAHAGEHARKLYSLFARDHGAYVGLGGPPSKQARLEQTVVKESYLIEPMAAPPKAGDPVGAPSTDHFWPYAKRDDGSYVHAGAVAGVFVVIEKAASTPGTDEGFVYGTVTAEGVVTSAGRVASCMGCHEKAKYGRWFGTVDVGGR